MVRGHIDSIDTRSLHFGMWLKVLGMSLQGPSVTVTASQMLFTKSGLGIRVARKHY